MKKQLLKMLNAKTEERQTLQATGEKCEDIQELRSINSQVEKLNSEIEELRGMIQSIEAGENTAEGQVEGRTAAVNEGETGEVVSRASALPGFNPVQGTNSNQVEGRAEFNLEKEREQRGKELKEKRSVTVGSGTIVLPKYTSNEIGGTFNEVSSLIDGVTHKPLIGGESYTKPYVKAYGEGDYTAENGTATTAETDFGYAEMSKAKVTAYAEDTEEVEKLPAAAYADEVEKGIKISLRKKLSREILIGDGATNHLKGIFTTDVIEASTDVEVTAIGNTTLDDIIFGYGGDEDVEDACTLILNKSDLKAFSQLRTTDGKKYHTIVAKGNAGTIDGIPYLINSACKSVGATETTAGQYCMAYGPLSAYELAIFSDVDIKKSSDYKFKEGMIAHRGVGFFGGNVVRHNGFLRIKKK